VDDQKMKVFITGVGGALGRELAPALKAKGFTVIGNDIKSPEDIANMGLIGVEYLWRATEDIRGSDLENADVVINLSATADRPMGLSSPLHTIHNNLIPTARLLETCRNIKLDKFIQLGSGTIYLGISESELPAIESTTPKPTNPYSASKYAQDIFCQSYYYAYDLPVIIVRSGMTYGAGRLAIAPHRFIIQALKNESITVYGGRQTRTPTHINDIVEYCVKLVEAPSQIWKGKIVHAVYPTNSNDKGEYSLVEMAEIIKNIVGAESEIVPSEYESGEHRLTGPAREWIISTTAEKLGVKPKIRFEEGLRLTVDWIRSRMANTHHS
jgi:UDP-glucuronate 4-epimerase